jgi:threonine dehydrogenase-like Zn-dependent dehydrogenase
MYCLKKEGIVDIIDYPLKNGIKLQPIYTGICRTDIKVLNNEIKTDDIILGHETSAIVLENSTNFKKGEIVAVIPLIKDKFLGLDIDGTICENIYIHPKNIILTNFEPKISAFLEPIAASMSVLNTGINKNKKGAILGINRISELTLIILRSYNFDIENFDNNKNYDYIIETEIPNFNILKNMNNKGLLIIKSRNFNNFSFVPNDLVMKEIKIISAKYYDFKKSLKWLIENYKLIEHLFGKEYKIDDYKKAFDINNNDYKNFIIH